MTRIKWSYDLPSLGYSAASYNGIASCSASDQTNYAYMDLVPSYGNGFFSFYPSVHKAKRTSPAFYIIGPGDKQYGLLPLPFTLDPNSTTKCALLTNIDFLGPTQMTDANDDAYWSAKPINLPHTIHTAGVQLFIQGLYFDAKLPLGVGTTRGLRIKVPTEVLGSFPPKTAEYLGKGGLITQFSQ